MMQSNVKLYTKAQIIHKLSAQGVFVDHFTLDSFLKKWNIEAVFEDDKGEEFFDKDAYENLFSNIAKKNPAIAALQQEPTKSDRCLDEIKWQAWQDISGDLCEEKEVKIEEPQVAVEEIKDEAKEERTPEVIIEEELIQTPEQPSAQEAVQEELPQAQAVPEEIQLPEPVATEEHVSTVEESVSLQESSLVQENAIKSMISGGVRNDNVFRLDISEETLDMIAKSISKRIVAQVNAELATFHESQQRLLTYEEKNNDLILKLKEAEEEKKQLEGELEESLEHLGRFKKSIFGFYRFIKKKRKK